MRKGPGRVPSAVPEERPNDKMVVDKRTYEFLTPVFGGGVKVDGHQKPYDEVTPIRAASIRGQLRFWWRACNRRGCGNVSELQQAEEEIFGSTAGPSRLFVEVEQPKNPTRLEVLKRRDRENKKPVWEPEKGLEPIYYASFPLRDTRDKVPEEQRTHGVLHKYTGTWTVCFQYPEGVKEDVQSALWAWAHFGGLGGRTRRGFGAIAEVTPGTLLSIDEGREKYVKGIAVPWPHMAAVNANVLVVQRGPWDNGFEAQKYLLRILWELRQGSTGRKDGGKNIAGRSFWPEPDAIRAITKCSHPKHQQRVTRHDVFPRAAFGMPIIFHFKDAPSARDNGKNPKEFDPKDTTLVPQGKSRFASPLILRPHRSPDGKYEALALVLEPRDAGRVELRGPGPTESTGVRHRIDAQEARGIPAVPERPSPLVKDGKTFADPIERYLCELAPQREKPQ